MFQIHKNKTNLPTKTPGSGVDFHMHTTASDGMWTPQTLVDTAVAQGLRVMTVSDHDTFKNVRPVQALAARHGITVVPGVEITINWQSAVFHMLVFNYDLDNAELAAMLDDTEAQTVTKQAEIIEGLHKQGYKLHKLDDLKREDGTFLTVEIVRALVKGGEVATFDQAYRLCVPLGIERTSSQPAERAIKTALKAGGLPVVAHPGRAEYGFSSATPAILRDLVEFGLAGVEVYHYSHQPADIERYSEFARQHNLVISAGSDSHNESRKPTAWNPQLLRPLLERLNLKNGLDFIESAAS